MARPFTDDEIGELQRYYPGLSLKEPGVVGGVLDLHAQFGDTAFQDKFEIRISSENPNSDYLPALREVGGRTQAIATARGIRELKTLHRNSDDTACVCPVQAEREKCPLGYSLLHYVEQLVVPYLYGLCYFEAHGIWSWPELSHGVLGLLEYYAAGGGMGTTEEVDEVLGRIRADAHSKEYQKQLRNPSAKRACPCGSGKRFGRCHREAWVGLNRMRQLLVKAGLEPRKVL